MPGFFERLAEEVPNLDSAALSLVGDQMPDAVREYLLRAYARPARSALLQPEQFFDRLAGRLSEPMTLAEFKIGALAAVLRPEFVVDTRLQAVAESGGFMEEDEERSPFVSESLDHALFWTFVVMDAIDLATAAASADFRMAALVVAFQFAFDLGGRGIREGLRAQANADFRRKAPKVFAQYELDSLTSALSSGYPEPPPRSRFAGRTLGGYFDLALGEGCVLDTLLRQMVGSALTEWMAGVGAGFANEAARTHPWVPAIRVNEGRVALAVDTFFDRVIEIARSASLHANSIDGIDILGGRSPLYTATPTDVRRIDRHGYWMFAPTAMFSDEIPMPVLPEDYLNAARPYSDRQGEVLRDQRRPGAARSFRAKVFEAAGSLLGEMALSIYMWDSPQQEAEFHQWGHVQHQPSFFPFPAYNYILRNYAEMRPIQQQGMFALGGDSSQVFGKLTELMVFVVDTITAWYRLFGVDKAWGSMYSQTYRTQMREWYMAGAPYVDDDGTHLLLEEDTPTPSSPAETPSEPGGLELPAPPPSSTSRTGPPSPTTQRRTGSGLGIAALLGLALLAFRGK